MIAFVRHFSSCEAKSYKSLIKYLFNMRYYEIVISVLFPPRRLSHNYKTEISAIFRSMVHYIATNPTSIIDGCLLILTNKVASYRFLFSRFY